MAVREIRVDDIDGKTEGAEEIKFAFDGTRYTIDLAEKNRAAFEKAIQPYIDAATEDLNLAPANPGQAYVARIQTNAKAKTDQLNDIRTWAKAQGMEVSDRGRIAGEIQDKFFAAHPGLTKLQ